MEIVCQARQPGIDKLTNAIPILADQGVTSVEISLNELNFFDYHNAAEVTELLSVLSTSGVRVHSIHGTCGPNYDLSSLDDEVHDRGVDSLIDSIELASLLDAEKIIVHASHVVNGDKSKRMERARGVLREMGKVALESGIILTLENLLPGFLGHTPDEIISLLDGTDSNSVAVCFDCGHANLSGHFFEFASALLPHAAHIHMHDNDGTRDQHQFPGLGNIDWSRFGATYKLLGCRANIMLECSSPEGMVWSEAFQVIRSSLGQ